MAATAVPSRALRRRIARDLTFGRWTIAWFGGSLREIANGIVRETVYGDRVGELTANQISGATLVLLAAYFRVLDGRWPIRSGSHAAAIGATWVVLTVAFEFLFGRYVDRDSWSELLENFNLAAGELLILVLAWIGARPSVIRLLGLRRGAAT